MTSYFFNYGQVAGATQTAALCIDDIYMYMRIYMYDGWRGARGKRSLDRL